MVDCGLNTDDSFEIWDKLWRGLLRARPLQNLTFTHAHADHFGLAGFFVKEMKCAFACRSPNGSAAGRCGMSARKGRTSSLPPS